MVRGLSLYFIEESVSWFKSDNFFKNERKLFFTFIDLFNSWKPVWADYGHVAQNIHTKRVCHDSNQKIDNVLRRQKAIFVNLLTEICNSWKPVWADYGHDT